MLKQPTDFAKWQACRERQRGPITTSFRMDRDGDAEVMDREKTWRGVAPHHQTRGLGSITSSPSGVQGRAPTENGFYVYLRSERSHLEHPVQYFWAVAGLPKCPGARENFPLSTGLLSGTRCKTTSFRNSFHCSLFCHTYQHQTAFMN